MENVVKKNIIVALCLGWASSGCTFLIAKAVTDAHMKQVKAQLSERRLQALKDAPSLDVDRADPVDATTWSLEQGRAMNWVGFDAQERACFAETHARVRSPPSKTLQGVLFLRRLTTATQPTTEAERFALAHHTVEITSQTLERYQDVAVEKLKDADGRVIMTRETPVMRTRTIYSTKMTVCFGPGSVRAQPDKLIELVYIPNGYEQEFMLGAFRLAPSTQASAPE